MLSPFPPLSLCLPFLPLLLLTLPPTLRAETTNSQPFHTLTLHHHTPLSTSAPLPLAILSYNPHQPSLSTLLSFTPPANTTDLAALTSVIVYHGNNHNHNHNPSEHSSNSGEKAQGGVKGKGESYSSTVTTTYSFHPPCTGRFRIALDRDGGVVGASWHSRFVLNKNEKGDKGRRGDFDILGPTKAPAVVFEKGVNKGKGKGAGVGPGVGAEGEEEVVEKTMLQKYWWVLLGVAVLAMAGGGDK